MLSTKTLLAAAAGCFLLAFIVPTAAITVGEDPASDEVVLEPVDERYATIEDGELALDLSVVGDTKTTFTDVFTIDVGADAEDVEAIWIDHDVAGVTFHADGSELTESSRLEPSPGDTIRVGVAVDSSVARASTETFTVNVRYADEDPQQGDVTPPSPAIEASNLSVSPTTLETGETVTANATYRNRGNATGERVAELTVDGTVVDRQRLRLEPEESTTVTFDRRMDWPGTYDVGIDGAGSQSVTVEGPPIDVVETTLVGGTVEAGGMDVSLTAGESATVRATVRNPTDTRVERTLELAVDGVVVDSRAVSIPANGERTVTFERRFDEAGRYEIAVSGITAGTVTVDERAGFSIRNRELSPVTTAAIAPPATAGLLFLAMAANRRWAFVR